MIAHPNRSRSRLAQYGARLRTIEGRKTVETVDPNDGARRRFQYRRSPGGGLERRILRSDGSPFIDTGSPWEPYTAREIAAMAAQRGEYHPILDPLGLDEACVLFLDEVDKAPRDCVAAVLTLIASRTVRGRALHPGTRLVAAMQPVDPEEALADETGRALAARMCYLQVGYDWAYLGERLNIDLSSMPTSAPTHKLPILPAPTPRGV